MIYCPREALLSYNKEKSNGLIFKNLLQNFKYTSLSIIILNLLIYSGIIEFVSIFNICMFWQENIFILKKQIVFQNKISPMSSDARLMGPYGKSEKNGSSNRVDRVEQ